MVLDIFVLIILVLFVIIGRQNGLVKGLFSLVSWLVSGVLSCFLGNAVANWVYDNYIETSITESLVKAFELSSPQENIINNLPKYLYLLLNLFGVNNVETGETYNSLEEFTKFTTEALHPIITGVLNVIFIIVIFIVFMIIFLLIKKLLLSAKKIPVIKSVDKFFGGVLGLCKGLIFVLVSAIIIKILVDNGIVENLTSIVNQSYVCKFIYENQFIKQFFSLFKL